ncbi:MAG: zf-HC2 domain-containing protein [Myxococcota bacterium]
MNCGDLRKLADAYFDGEFADDDRRDLEAHAAACVACGRHVETERRYHDALRVGLRGLDEPVPPALAGRIDAALAAAARPTGRAEAARPSRTRAWVVTACLAAAASAASLFFVQRRDERLRALDAATAAASVSIVEAVVESHRRDLPVEVASVNPEDVRHWFQGKIDVPVRPPHMRTSGARLVGGRVSNVRERQAAQLVYDLGGRKVSVLIFDPDGMRLDAPRRQRVRDHDVALGGRRGYNVALFQDRGLGYAVAGEADDAEIMNFVHAAFAP